MAKTKQTSKKTTGGPAKRGVLSTSVKTRIVTSQLAAKNAKLRASKSPVPKLSVPVPKLPVPELTLKPLINNAYCFFCRDGGDMYDCFLCPRTVCAECIVIPKVFLEQVKDPGIRFICPGCHEMREKRDKNPYFGFERADGTPLMPVPAKIIGHSEMTSRSQLCNNPILVLHFVLDSLADPCSSPTLAMYNILKMYRTCDSLQYHEIVFDFGTEEKSLKYAQSMEELVEKIKMLSYERVEILISTHSETERGDIWGGFEDGESMRRRRHTIPIRGEPVAYSVPDFFAGLFVGGIEDYARGSTMWMFICGHTVRKLDAFRDLKACVKYYEVEHTFAFDADLFHACLTSSFVTAYVERVLIEGLEVQDTIHDLLAVCPRLGMHASITHLHIRNAFRRRLPTIAEYNRGQICICDSRVSMTVTTYTFFHDNKRPWGNALPYQCPRCSCIRTWKSMPSSQQDQRRFTCRAQGCGFTITCDKPPQREIILFTSGYHSTNLKGEVVKQGKGKIGSGWLVSVAVESGAPADDCLTSCE
ncbi:hypothetical protein BDR07DRAFT_1413530 [Suillus spraguei]|nr:hypothetical protein BDR07DRAFT_1413530 [Suillus spraguei]